MKKIFLLLIILTLSQNLFSKDLKIGTMLPDKEPFRLIVSGIKSKDNKIKIINLLKEKKDVDIIVAYENYIPKAVKSDKKVIGIVDSERNIKKYFSFNLCKIFLLNLPITLEVKKVKKYLKDIKTFSVVISDKKLYNDILKKKIPELKVFYVKNMGEVPYKIDIALKASDVLLAIPDNVVFNYFSNRFILKKALLSGKLVVAYTKDMLKMGAYLAIIPDFVRIGTEIYHCLKKSVNKKIMIPKCVKIIKNKIFSRL